MNTLGDKIRDLVITEGLDSACEAADKFEKESKQRIDEQETEIFNLSL